MLRLESLGLPHVKYRCVIDDSTGGMFFQETFRGYPVYEIGVCGAPRYRVHTQDSDNPWSLEFLAEGGLFTAATLERGLAGAMSPLGPAANASMAVIPHLPDGEYLVCELPDAGEPRREVSMGNFGEDVPFDVLAFGQSASWKDDGVDLVAFGRTPDSRVDVGQLMVGVTFLNFLGCGGNNTAVWLFNLVDDNLLPPLTRPTAIIPVVGTLVPAWWSSVTQRRWWRDNAIDALEKSLA